MIYKIENNEVTRDEFLNTLNTGHYEVLCSDEEENLVFSQELYEIQFKQKRNLYIDAYRKYQAAVNYGEFERVPAVDSFIERLRNKDWEAFEIIPPQIKYFNGEISFSRSELNRI